MGKLNPIFLNQGSILPWERPLGEGVVSMLQFCNGSTTLVSQIGFDAINETFGDYNVIASAAKYSADIARLQSSSFVRMMLEDKTSNEPKNEILFSGGISIYKFGVIPGTKLRGYDLAVSDKIWAGFNSSPLLLSDKGLLTLIKGKNPVLQIERIVAGYNAQKRAAAEAEGRARQHSFESGRETGEYETRRRLV